VALAVVTAVLAAIGGLVATSTRGATRLERHVELVQAARAIESALPRAEKLVGNLSGELAGHHWRVDVMPFPGDDIKPEQSSAPWVPQTILITVRSAGGGSFQLATVRLRRGAKEAMQEGTKE
jgi:general secretion pathway protein I